MTTLGATGPKPVKAGHRCWHLLAGFLLLACTSDLDKAFNQSGIDTGTDEGTDVGTTDTSPTDPSAGSDVTPGGTDEPTNTDLAESDGTGTDEPVGGTEATDPGTDVSSTDEPAVTDPIVTDDGAPTDGTPTDEMITDVAPEAGVPDAGVARDGGGDPVGCAVDACACDSGGCGDQCPDDPNKDEPGECGCGRAEETGDSDGDIVIDCLDSCRDDPLKTEPGVCGCDIAEETDDTDGDGVPLCLDGCPDNPDKASPGVCGCEMPDTESAGGDVLCEVLAGALEHRYSFRGFNATVATDLVGSLDGDIIGAQTSGGSLTVAGGTSDQYVNLPNALFDGITDLTIELWVTWSGSTSWQRIFDFGESDAGEDVQGSGTGYLFLTPQSGVAPAGLRAAFRPTGGTEVVTAIADSLPTNVESHVAVVFDDTGDELLLFLDGVRVAATPVTNSLSDVTMINNWLARSQFTPDDEFAGSYNELRIYSAALSAEALSFSFAQGPSAVFP